MVATEDEAGRYRGNVAAGFVTRNYNECFVTRDMVDVVSMLSLSTRLCQRRTTRCNWC